MDVENDNQNTELSLHQDVNKLHLAANGSSQQNHNSDHDMDQNTLTAASTVLTIHKTTSKQNNREEIPPFNAVGTKPPDTISDSQQQTGDKKEDVG